MPVFGASIRQRHASNRWGWIAILVVGAVAGAAVALHRLGVW